MEHQGIRWQFPGTRSPNESWSMSALKEEQREEYSIEDNNSGDEFGSS